MGSFIGMGVATMKNTAPAPISTATPIATITARPFMRASEWIVCRAL